MHKGKNNISVIGMAGVGKTYLGKALARKIGYRCIEIDQLITKEAKKRSLNKNLVSDKEFIRLEEQAILSLRKKHCSIFDTGGSVIYSPKAMSFLKSASAIIYLRDKPKNIKARFDARGEIRLIGLQNKSFDTLLKQRAKLYRKYADIIVDVSRFRSTKKFLDTVIGKVKLVPPVHSSQD